MIRVNIKIIGALIRPGSKKELFFDMEEFSSLKALLKKLNYNESHMRFIIASVNGAYKTQDYVLRDNDFITLKTVIGGG